MSKTFTIEVLNKNEPPVTTHFKDTNSLLNFLDDFPLVKENSPIGTVVGVLSAFDHDAGQSLSFMLDDDANGRFQVERNGTCQSIPVSL